MFVGAENDCVHVEGTSNRFIGCNIYNPRGEYLIGILGTSNIFESCYIVGSVSAQNSVYKCAIHYLENTLGYTTNISNRFMNCRFSGNVIDTTNSEGYNVLNSSLADNGYQLFINDTQNDTDVFNLKGSVGSVSEGTYFSNKYNLDRMFKSHTYVAGNGTNIANSGIVYASESVNSLTLNWCNEGGILIIKPTVDLTINCENITINNTNSLVVSSTQPQILLGISDTNWITLF